MAAPPRSINPGFTGRFGDKVMRRLPVIAALAVLTVLTLSAQGDLTARVYRVIKAAGVPIVGLSIGDSADKATWKVQPANLQGAAQPTINAFDPNDPALETAELDTQVKAILDNERLSSAIVWMILKQMFPADTDAQTKTKYGVARTRIIDAFKVEPWK